jgi:DNA-binding CsgD family transcriptional regulator
MGGGCERLPAPVRGGRAIETDDLASAGRIGPATAHVPAAVRKPEPPGSAPARAFPPLPDMPGGWSMPAAQGHVAAIAVSPAGRIAGCDEAGHSLLARGDCLRAVDGHLSCVDAQLQPKLASALREAHESQRTFHLLLTGQQPPVRRFSLIVRRPRATGAHPQPAADHVLCLVTALDRRRIATARQLMDLLNLTAAEARLARGLAGGESVEEFARTQGLKASTVRSQLSAIFQKTRTDRQVTLVSLIAAIPVLRD